MRVELSICEGNWYSDPDVFLCGKALSRFVEIPGDVEHIDLVGTKGGNSHSYKVCVDAADCALNVDGELVEVDEITGEWFWLANQLGYKYFHIEY